MSKKYVVYKHTTPNGKHYIGITCKTPTARWGSDGSGYKTQLFWRAIQKYGWDNIKHEILYVGLSKEEAKTKEIELIAKYQSDNPNYGYNQTKGGDSTYEGKKNPRKDLGNLRENWKGSGNPNARPVICLETLKIYGTAKEAIDDTGATKLLDCCHKRGKHKTSGNYHWSFYDDDKELSDYLFLLEKCLKEETQPRHLSDRHKEYIRERSSVPVMCVETQIIYSSLHEASKSVGLSPASICYCCKGKTKTAKGFHWEYMKKEKK